MVLVIDDCADFRELIAIILKRSGFAVWTAADAYEGLAKAGREIPELILLDLRMPGMDGRQFVERFREQHGHAIPIIVVTAEDARRVRAAEIGASCVIGKPFGPNQLISAVKQFLNETGD